MAEQKLKLIALESIYPHPDNPRKDLGDLTELTESIRKNGIMQNLTVMPGHFLTEAEQRALQEKYAETKDQQYLKEMAEGWSKEGYTLLIGHRRAAAARAAKISVVPCTVVHLLDRREQVAIMLEENMQRTDLTVREQAQGFQMMLDLGDTVDDVAKKTGFSKQTVKHRLEIAKLDPKAIEAAEDGGYYQISISDYMKLEKLPTVEDRNAVLKDARNGRQLDYKINSRLQEIENERRKKIIVGKLEAMGIRQAPKNANTWTGEYEEETLIRNEECDKEIRPFGKPETVFWVERYGGIDVIRKTDKKNKTETESAWQKEQRYNDKRKKAMRQIQKEMEANRHSFCLRIANRDVMPPPEEEAFNTLELLIDVLLDGDMWIDKMGLMEYILQKDRYQMSEEEKADARIRISGMSRTARLICAIDRALGLRTGTDQGMLIDYQGKPRTEQMRRLDNFYLILEEFYGYVRSDAEEKILSGTHELFREFKDLTAKEKKKI